MQLFIITLIVMLTTHHAYAASPLGNVGGAGVKSGVTAIEMRAGYTADGESRGTDERWQTRQLIDHGFNDWFALRLITTQDMRQDDNLEHAAVTIESRFQLIEKRDHGWDGGIRFAYTQRDGDKTPHGINMRAIAAVPLGEQWKFTHNTVISHDVGENSRSGLSIELRDQIMYGLDNPPEPFSTFSIGLEMYNDFGKLNRSSGYDNQDHQFGPVIKANFDNGFYMQTGYRAGISDSAADHLVKLFVGKKF